jgi:diadenosine tetraphosphatase ApaH/serine/threonine PP2A family protein phosphatase
LAKKGSATGRSLLLKGTGVKRALISDIHGNIEALRAVLQDIRSQGITDIFCLGDIVGYGPNPCECLDEVISRCEFKTILGNHDQAVLVDPSGFNPVALRAVYWTRDTLESKGARAAINRRLDFLGELPQKKVDGKFLFVHGSPREHVNEYVFPEDVYNQLKMDTLFGRVECYCFQGHTHIPGVFTTDGDFVTPERCNYEYPLGPEKVMVNVGSVGQPRDGDPRACYVILQDDRLTYRRVPYDVETTANKIFAIAELDNSLGNRIRVGQ